MKYKLLFLLGIIITGILVFNFINFKDNSVSIQNKESDSLLNFSARSLVFNSTNYSDIQFYPNLRFPSKYVNYSFEDTCTPTQKQRFYQAFQTLENLTVLRFNQTDSPQIKIFCNEISALTDSDQDLFGQGQSDINISYTNYSIISDGRLFIYGTFGMNNCTMPYSTEIHELMHIFGFKHNLNPLSIMFPVSLTCNLEMDEYLIDDINKLYDEEI